MIVIHTRTNTPLILLDLCFLTLSRKQLYSFSYRYFLIPLAEPKRPATIVPTPIAHCCRLIQVISRSSSSSVSCCFSSWFWFSYHRQRQWPSIQFPQHLVAATRPRTPGVGPPNEAINLPPDSCQPPRWPNLQISCFLFRLAHFSATWDRSYLPAAESVVREAILAEVVASRDVPAWKLKSVPSS